MAESLWRRVRWRSRGPDHTQAAGPPRRRVTLVQQFQLVSLSVLLIGMLSTGWWLGGQIRDQVMSHAVELNSVYIESIVSPQLQDLQHNTAAMPEEDIAELNRLLATKPIGDRLAAFIVWGPGGRVLYSTERSEIGRSFMPGADLQQAFAGQPTWEFADAQEDDHTPAQSKSSTLLALYAPVLRSGSNQVIAVAEFYQPGDELLLNIASAQREAWLLISAITISMYLLLGGFIRRASDTITRQQDELNAQVRWLTDLVEQNEQLHDRVRRATHRNATLYERVMRRISADLHDGPAQNLGAALLHLDRVAAYHEEHPDPRADQHLESAQGSLTAAMAEIRAISGGLGAPQIDGMAVGEVIEQVVAMHEQRTQTEVELRISQLPSSVGLAIKLTLYRVLQEGLNNAYRHGLDIGQQVAVDKRADQLLIQVADSGPGFQADRVIKTTEHMGLMGMRDRVESLGGQFLIQSAPGQGTTLSVQLPLHSIEDT